MYDSPAIEYILLSHDMPLSVWVTLLESMPVV